MDSQGYSRILKDTSAKGKKARFKEIYSRHYWQPKANIVSGYLEEMIIYYKLARFQKEEGDILEIGSAVGVSTCFLAEAVKERNKGEKVYTIDPFEEVERQEEMFKENIRKMKLEPWIISNKGRSQVLLEKDTNKYRLIFIDGSHNFEDVYQDIKLSLERLKKEGLIINHDYSSQFPGVVKAMNLFLKEGKIKRLDQTLLTFVGIKKGDS